jgi:23S rRNA-/tRNA-specific pseudouridylate synthase
MTNEPMITFPPGALGPAPVRLPLLASEEMFFAVAKPAGIGVWSDALDPEGVPLLVPALEQALAAGKKQLRDLGIARAGGVHRLDIEATGVVLLARTEAAEAVLRNAAGSRQIEFVYDLVTERGRGEPRAFSCDLPLVRDEEAGRMVVSHRRGKQCATQFVPVREFARHVLWEARTHENRTHQVRVHAAESGSGIVGERIYGRVPLVFLAAIKPGFRPGRDERPLHGPLALHLREVVLALPALPAVAVRAPRPRSFEAMLERLARHAEERNRGWAARTHP